MPPMRSYRPDFRSIYKNLNAYDREQGAIKMDSTYDVITKIVDVQSLNEAETASLVHKYTLAASVHHSEKCFQVIMGAIWPAPVKPVYILFNNTDPLSAPGNPTVGTLVEHALGIQTTVPANDTKSCKVFQVSDSISNIAVDDDRLIIEKEGRAVSLLGQLLPTGGSRHNPTTAHPSNATVDTANNATQTPPSSDPFTSSPSPDATVDTDTANNATHTPPSLEVPPEASTSDPPSFLSNHPFYRTVRSNFPIQSGQQLRRTYAFTELSVPGAQTIILGPRPPPDSILPPAQPPQPSGPGALPLYNIPEASVGISNSGATSGITEEVGIQPLVSPQSPPSDSSNNSRKRSRDELSIDAPSQSSLPDDTTHAVSAAPASTLAPSNNGEGSSNQGSPKKRNRDAEEDDEEIARPSARRRESPAVRPRYPSPTPSDRRIGRIVAPIRKSIRLSPRSSSDADTGSLGAARNEGDPLINSPALPSGSSVPPLASSDSPSASRKQKAKKVAKA